MKEIHQGFRLLGDEPEFAFEWQPSGAPWPSVAAAHNGADMAFLRQGRRRYIDQGDGKGIIEYWYKGGIQLANLVPRYPNLDSETSYLAELTALRDETEEIANDAREIVTTGAIYKGFWDPVNNVPNLTTVGPAGTWYEIGATFTRNLGGGAINWVKGNKIISKGTVWEQTEMGAIPKDGAVSNLKLGDDVAWKNYPWLPNSISPDGAIIRAAISDIQLYGADQAKTYLIGIIAKKFGGSTEFVVRIHEYVTPGAWPVIYDFTKSNYVPSSFPERIELRGTGQRVAYVTIDWSLIPDGFNPVGLAVGHTGISKMCYKSATDNKRFMTSQIADLQTVKSSTEQKVLASKESLVLENTVTKTISHALISAVRIGFVQTELNFNTFKFPGHNLTHASAKNAFCVIRTLNGEKESRTVEFDKRTSEYSFTLSRTYSLMEGVFITWGYCDELGKTFIPGVPVLWAAGNVDPNQSTAQISVLTNVRDIFESPGDLAQPGWNCTNYRLLMSTDVVVGPLVAPSDVSKAITENNKNFPALRVTDSSRIESKELTPVYNQAVVRDIGSTNFAAIILVLASVANKFDTFSFPGHNFSNVRAKYAFCLVDDGTTKELQRIRFDKRVTNYDFVLPKLYDQSKASIKITFGYCDESNQTFSPFPVTLMWSKDVADANLLTRIRYIPQNLSIDVAGTLAESAAFKTSAYTLSTSSKIVQRVADIAPTIPKLVLPSKFYPLADSKYWFYHDTIIKYFEVYDKLPYGLSMVSRLVSNGLTTNNVSWGKDFGQVLGTGAATNLTVQICDYLHRDATGAPLVVNEQVIGITPKAKPAGKTVNVLFIMDSLGNSDWEGVGYIQQVMTMAAAGGNTIISKGTRPTTYKYPANTGATVYAEAFGSWTEQIFTTRFVPDGQRAPVGDVEKPTLHCPFMFSPDNTLANASFSFSQYMSTYNIGQLDVVCILLGTNPVSPATNTGLSTQIMIDSIRQYSATLPVIVGTVPPGSSSRMNIDTELDQVRKLEQSELLISRFDKRDAEKIFVAPRHMPIHRLYGLRNVMRDITAFPLENKEEVVLYNGATPTTYTEKKQQLFLTDIHHSAQGIKTDAQLILDHILYHAP
ncbi:hypothetical protein SAMN05216327_101186 [Dyadobacter sp. SG02]|uniref:hypothetical protein n=1 Tax=Dyadobacter sp. SG02 TaxID=1855291 RepID=UPI0008BFD54A|nr:hypothetical protein [Dyadobacter sp. SG02]SEI39335.1 hypothetical protein SAMN05216327_101186 [Dyadobacter sp. SG02]